MIGPDPCGRRIHDNLDRTGSGAERRDHVGVAHDEARVDVVVSCFTEDTVFEVAQGSAEPFNRIHGRTELLAWLTSIIAEQGDQRRHLIGNILIEKLDLADGTAAAIAFSVVTVAANG